MQYYDGVGWRNLSVEEEIGFSAKASVGEVTVTLAGNVSINVAGPTSGWGVEAYYT